MTEQEKIIATGFTNTVFVTDFSKFKEDAERRLGEPILTHEYVTRATEIKELYREDFLKMCYDQA